MGGEEILKGNLAAFDASNIIVATIQSLWSANAKEMFGMIVGATKILGYEVTWKYSEHADKCTYKINHYGGTIRGLFRSISHRVINQYR